MATDGPGSRRHRVKPELLARVCRIAGSEPISWDRVNRGYTGAERWIVRFKDDSSCFVKGANSPHTATWLREEYRVYGSLKADFLPNLRAWEGDGANPLLLLEDLSRAHWPPPWNCERINLLRSTLDRVHATIPPRSLPRLSAMREDFSGWQRIAADPGPFLSVGLCSAEWLDSALPLLIEAERAAILDGDDLVYLDARSDNVCFADGRAVLVDWNWARVGNGRIDFATWAPSLHIEGGPPPEEILSDEPELVAAVTGYWASKTGLTVAGPPAAVRQLQRHLLRVALPWTAKGLGLPAP